MLNNTYPSFDTTDDLFEYTKRTIQENVMKLKSYILKDETFQQEAFMIELESVSCQYINPRKNVEFNYFTYMHCYQKVICNNYRIF